MSRAIAFSDRSADRPDGNLLPRDGDVRLIEDALSEADADHTFDILMKTVDWRQERAVLFGRRIPVPRLTAWYGERAYGYSGIRHEARPLPPPLLALKETVEAYSERRFNSVLLNLYRDGRDSMGWHADDEAALGPEPEIASLSLGAVRRFQLEHRADGERVTLDLGHGSLLIMRGRCQACWRHQLPKTKKAVGPRINLTFRTVIA